MTPVLSTVRPMKLGSRRGILFCVVACCLFAGLLELISLLAIQFTPIGSFYFRPPDASTYAVYIRSRSPRLGWPRIENEFAVRPSPASSAFPESVDSFAVFGDSFTFGEEVSDEDAWCNRLATLAGLRVLNFGVGGYGTDQAFIRYRESGDVSRRVVLGVLTENVIRNVNRYRNIISGGSEIKFKPRFIEAADGVQEVPLPLMPTYPVADSLAFPEEWLRDDYFVDTTRRWPLRDGFPYTLSLARLLDHWSFGARIKGMPMHADFLASGHPSRAIYVTAGIARLFHRLATERGAESFVLIIPTCREVEYYQAVGEKLHEDLARLLQAEGPTWDATDYLSRSADRPVDLYMRRGGHMNPDGNLALARFVQQHLKPN